MGTTWDTIDRYVVISTDTHAGADIDDYKPYLPARLHDEFDAWAKTYVSPFDDLIIATAEPELGPRSTDRRHGRRRGGRRGAAAQHRPAVLPDHPQHHHQPAADSRRVREAVGGGTGPQPLADRLLFAGPGPVAAG